MYGRELELYAEAVADSEFHSKLVSSIRSISCLNQIHFTVICAFLKILELEDQRPLQTLLVPSLTCPLFQGARSKLQLSPRYEMRQGCGHTCILVAFTNI